MRPTVQSIRSKVMLVVLATTISALVVVAIALVIYESRTYERSTADGLMTQAQIIGRSTAPALVFDDPAAARDNLALLKVQPQIRAAAIYTRTGRLFASYGAADERVAGASRTPPQADSYSVEGGEIVVVRPIVEDRDVIGTIYLRASYDLDRRLRDYLSILGIVLVASLAFALLLSAGLQRAITGPIIAVTDVARKVIDRRDFSLRVGKTTHDEVGYLVDAFNAMLAEVGRRADALEASNATLSRESAERREAEEALRIADRRKDEFLAMLAHELRNPLAPLRNALEILKRSDAGSPMADDARLMMERQLRQMVRLVDDLLDVSRITTGKLALKPELCELRDIVGSAVDTARPVIEARQHALAVDMPAEPVFVTADPTRLSQVFSNLLNNAANYTEPGGRIQLAADADDTSVTVRVIDNGIGIADEMLGPVFQMFAQADESLERVHGGLGVGLTLARHLVELHNGTIEAQSEGAGRGSTFVVRLPRAPAAPRIAVHNAAPPSGGEAPNASTAGKRVLIADDNVDFATSLEAILTALGHDVLVTHDGDAALETALRVVPDIAFVDIGLPGRNGYDVARSIRERGIGCKLIAVTGWGQDDDRRRSREAGFDVHLVKPVEPQLIIDIVDAQEAAVPAT
jgi:signal transduction histidine kinase/ActR/RegA family two-component response regulator